MIDYFLDTSKWPPRWRCGMWSTELGYTHIISDVVIWMSYMAIPVLLMFFLIKAKDKFPYPKVLVLFGLFILFCGFGHLVEAVIFYYPVYRLAALVKCITAFISVLTVIALVPIIPQILSIPVIKRMNKQLSDDLIDSNERFSIAFQGIGLELFDWNFEKNECVFSRKIASTFNVQNFDDFLNLIDEKDRGTIKEKLARTIETKKPFYGKFRMRVPDDGYRWHESYGQLAGNRLIGSIKDIQGQVQIEEEKNTKIDGLLENNDQLKEFSYLCAHDLKEPIRGVKTYITILQKEGEGVLNDSMTKTLNRMEHQCKRSEALIESLLNYSLIVNKNMELKNVDLDDIIKKVIDDIRLYVTEDNAEIEVLKELPTIICDGQRLECVFRNFLTNSIKYNSKNDKKVEIDFEENETEYIISVRDNGDGIENTESIFEMFTRGKNKVNNLKEGAGIGLALIRKIAKQHSGSVWLESVIGEGTTFYFSIGKVL